MIPLDAERLGLLFDLLAPDDSKKNPELRRALLQAFALGRRAIAELCVDSLDALARRNLMLEQRLASVNQIANTTLWNLTNHPRSWDRPSEQWVPTFRDIKALTTKGGA